MASFKAEWPIFKQIKPRTARRILAALVMLALLIALCITANMRANIQRQYSSARNGVGLELYDQLYMLCQTFDQVDVPGQNVQENILPAMKKYYAAARALNDAVSEAFGQRYELLSSEEIGAFDSAFDTYDAAFRSGRSTDSARSAMSACVQAARETLQERYDGERLKPAKSVK